MQPSLIAKWQRTMVRTCSALEVVESSLSTLLMSLHMGHSDLRRLPIVTNRSHPADCIRTLMFIAAHVSHSYDEID
jgi:hypothetical protein